MFFSTVFRISNCARSSLWVLILCAGLALSGTLGAATVVLDPGHGGHDPGGIPRQRFIEKKLALDVAKRIAGRLRASGHKVVLTRASDVFVPLPRRVAIANQASPKAIFVSVHFNSAPNPDAHGIETYYYSERSARLTESIHRRVVAATGGDDRGVRRARFYVLRYNRRVATLVELGFLTNPREGARIGRSDAYCQKLANAVAEGIMAVVR